MTYVNRRAGATTGAWPGIQAFGGWKGSGSTGKAGLSMYYVAQFMREQIPNHRRLASRRTARASLLRPASVRSG